MKQKKGFLLVMLMLFLGVGCSKENSEIENANDVNESKTTVTRYFNTIREADEFRAQQAKLLSKKNETTKIMSDTPSISKPRSGGLGKRMVSGSAYHYYTGTLGWANYNFEFENLKHYFPHILDFNVYLSTSTPILGAIILTAGSEILSGNQTSVNKNFFTISGSGTSFDASLYYIYEEKFIVGGIVVYHAVYKVVATVKRGWNNSSVIYATIDYQKIA